MISLNQINNQHVKAIPIPSSLDKRPIKGYDICEEIYANIFLCAKKKSGKTSALFKIMKECAIKKTIIIVFCSTVYKDENWIEIRKYFEKKGNDLRVYTSIYEDGQDQLANLIEELSKEARDDDEHEDKEDEPEIDPCDNILGRLGCMESKIPEPEYDCFRRFKREFKSRSL